MKKFIPLYISALLFTGCSKLLEKDLASDNGMEDDGHVQIAMMNWETAPNGIAYALGVPLANNVPNLTNPLVTSIANARDNLPETGAPTEINDGTIMAYQRLVIAGGQTVINMGANNPINGSINYGQRADSAANGSQWDEFIRKVCTGFWGRSPSEAEKKVLNELKEGLIADASTVTNNAQVVALGLIAVIGTVNPLR